eukprot:scaffold1116_cov340-Prasinococcus_capsulatus_cf.AAC.4
MDLATLCALPGQKPATDKMTVVSEAVRKIESLQQQGQQLREEVADLKHIVNDLRVRADTTGCAAAAPSCPCLRGFGFGLIPDADGEERAA